MIGLLFEYNNNSEIKANKVKNKEEIVLKIRVINEKLND